MADGDPIDEASKASPAAEQKKASLKPDHAAEQKQELGNNTAAMDEDKGEERNSRDQGLATAPSDQAAAVLAMLADACKQQQADAGADGDQAQVIPTAKRASNTAADDSGRPAKLARTSSTASQHQEEDAESEGAAAAPDSPTGSDAVAAAASLHKLSSASGAELEGSLAAFRAAVAATERTNAAAAAAAAAGGGNDRGLVSAADAQLLLGGLRRIGSGMSNVPLGSGGPLKPGQGKNSPVEIMEGLVETGLLQSYSPESHCYVKCGNVQGVFSLASGSILCLCNECSGNDPCWFAPAAFERHGGMAASKKWRGSIQVKGLSSRKTLGQWLDERGVTAKPRLTLADQVQQHTVVSNRSSRGGAAGGAAAAAAGLAAARGAAGSGDLSGAVAGVVRMNSASGLRRSSGHDSWNRSTGGGAAPSLARGISAGEGELLEALQHATGLPTGLQRSLSNTAQLMKGKQSTHQAAADGTAQDTRALHRGSLNSSQLDHLLDQVGVPRGGALGAATSAAAEASAQQQLAAAGIHPGALGASMPAPAQVPLNASRHLDQPSARGAAALGAADNHEAVSLLMQLLPSLPAEKAAAAAAALSGQQQQLPSLRRSTSNAQAEALAVAAMAAACRGPYSPPGAAAVKPEFAESGAAAVGLARHQSSVTAAAAHPGAVPSNSTHQLLDGSQVAVPMVVDASGQKRPLKDVLLLATATAAKNPSAASALLLEALQQQLEIQPASCRQAAAGAAAAVATAGDMLQNSLGGSRTKTPSAAAAFAAIAAAAAAAAATAAGLEEEEQRQRQEGADALAAAQLSPSMRPPRAPLAGAGGYNAAAAAAAQHSSMAGLSSAGMDAEAMAMLGASMAAGEMAQLQRLLMQQQQAQQQAQQYQQHQQQQQQVSQLLASLLEAAQMKHAGR